MTHNPLTQTPITIAPLAFGGNVFGWTIDEAMSFKLLNQFVDGGFNLIDTADVYSIWGPGHVGGESETILGNWIKQTGRRSEVVIATKVGMDMKENGKGLSRKHIFASVERSLNRLQTDYIDLYQAHKDDPETELEETLEAFNELVQSGKVKAIGASNYSGERLQQALDLSAANNWARYETLQPEYNLYAREKYEQDLLPVVQANNLSVISYFSLASGFLTGKYRTDADFTKSKRGGGMGKYLNARGLAIIKALDTVSAEHNTTQATVALAWLMSRLNLAAPIASATNPEQLAALMAAAHLKLDAEALALLDAASGY
jgi:aryl-alcohol dehydrogenase-like predicted oxidoreductase